VPPGGERAVLVAVALGGILAPLNSTMLAVALPAIVAEFHADVGTAGWLMTGYLLSLAVVQPVAGKLGDRFGRRPFMLGGLVVFGLASLGATVAPTLGVLIAMRMLQAVSGAIVFPNGSGLLRQLIPADRRARAFGTMGATLSLAAALGPPLGGLIVALGGWRAIFLVNVPVVLAALALAWRFVPRMSEDGRGQRTPFDRVGALLFPLLLLALALILIEGRHAPSLLLPATALVVLAGLGAVFLRFEAAHPDPVFQPRFFTRRGFAAATLGVSTGNLGSYTLMLAVPILLARHAGWSSLEIGLALALMSAPMVVFSYAGGLMADRVGRRAPAVLGCALMVVGLLPLVVAPGLPALWLLVCICLAGAGSGMAAPPMQTAAVEAVPAEHAGVAAGLFSTCRYLGSFIGSIALARLLDAGHGLDGFQPLFAVALAGAVAAVAASALLPAPRKTKTHAGPR
jgi:EmrB/QacA subfamily drug resistance transporter